MTHAPTKHATAVPLTGTIGALVEGVDLGRPLEEEAAAFLRQALYDHRVLVFPDQDLTHEQHLAFASGWGDLLPAHQFLPGMEEHPEIQQNDSGDRGERGVRGQARWHSDHTFVEEVPSVTTLVGRVIPPRGGDTVWADRVAAYDTLSTPMKTLVDSLVAVHDPSQQFAGLLRRTHDADSEARQGLLALGPVRQPLVRVHPTTGRRSLLVNPSCLSRIEGMEPDESDRLVDLLTRHTLVEERTFRWRWSAGDVVVWSNPEVLHRIVNDFGAERRLTERVMVHGPRLVGPSGFTSQAVAA